MKEDDFLTKVGKLGRRAYVRATNLGASIANDTWMFPGMTAYAEFVEWVEDQDKQERERLGDRGWSARSPRERPIPKP